MRKLSLALAILLASASLALAATPTATPTPTPTPTATPTPGVDDYPDLPTHAWIAPATHAAAVTPSDTAYLSDVTRWLFVGTGGNVAVVMQDGTSVTLVGVPNGTLLPIRVSRVMNTNTNASNITALW